MTIVVGGYIIAYPLGGMTWHHLNYLLGLVELGHEVIFLEDSGSYSVPYNPTTWQTDPDPTYGVDYLRRTFARYGLNIPWCYYSEPLDRYWGLSCDELNSTLARADVLLCVSGVTPIRPNRPRPRHLAVIDTDPVFTQLKLGRNEEFTRYFRQFDRVATFGTEIGKPHCPLPTHGIDWIPTRQPIALRHWPVSEPRSRQFTTIGKWEHTTDRHVEFAGRRYLSSKGPEWMKMIDLPRRVPGWEMTLGMQSMPGDTKAQFEQHGWRWVDPEPASISPWQFADYIAGSAGEFTVAKEIYTGLPSGWFSDRSSCYLASGRPVVTQSSGFERWMPTGEGCFSFTNVDEAAQALNAIAQDYPRHARAARALAEQHLSSSKVLPELLEQLM
jgi:hypothetical protein